MTCWSVSCVSQRAGQYDARRVASVLRHAADEGAVAASGQRPHAREGHSAIASCDLGHPFGSQEVHRIQSDGRSNAVSRLAQSLALVAATMMSYPGTPLAADESQRRHCRQGPDCGDRIAWPAVRAGRRCQPAGTGRLRRLMQDGNRYHVFVNADGRVIVEKIDQD